MLRGGKKKAHGFQDPAAPRRDAISGRAPRAPRPAGRHPDEIGQRARPQLLHDTAAVDLDGLLHGAQVGRDLLVELARDHVLEHLALARGERVEPRAQFVQRLLLGAQGLVALDRVAHRGNQHLRFDRFDEEIERALLHRAHALRHVAVSAQEQDRERAALAGQRALEVEPVQAGHVQVHDHAAVGARGAALEERLGRIECCDAQIGRAQHAADRFEHVGLVVDEVDSCGVPFHSRPRELDVLMQAYYEGYGSSSGGTGTVISRQPNRWASLVRDANGSEPLADRQVQVLLAAFAGPQADLDRPDLGVEAQVRGSVPDAVVELHVGAVLERIAVLDAAAQVGGLPQDLAEFVQVTRQGDEVVLSGQLVGLEAGEPGIAAYAVQALDRSEPGGGDVIPAAELHRMLAVALGAERVDVELLEVGVAPSESREKV
jgi:hypothetical protein